MRALPCALALALAACGGPSPDPDGGAAPDAGPAGPVAPIFDPAVFDGDGAFFDAPFPSELRVDADGRMDLSGFPQNRGLVADAIDVLSAEPPGASPLTGVYLRFDGPLDEGSLPDGPGAAAEEDSPVWLLDLDPESPDHGSRLPAYVRVQRAATRFWAANTLSVRAVPGVHLHPGRRYAVVVRDGLTAGGAPVVPSEAFEALKAGTGSALAEAYGALFDDLEAIGVDRADVRVATAFRVADPATEMDVARAWLVEQPLPTVRGWGVVSVSPRALTLTAEVDATSLMSGEPPFMTFGSGRIAFDADGAPTSARPEPMRVSLVVPNVDPPEGGFPVVVYAHGTGGDHLTPVGAEADVLLELGIATLGYEAALHGERASGALDPETLVVANPIGAREMARQTTIDAMLLYRLIAAGAFDPPGAVTSDQPRPLASSPVLFMGHSQGAQEGGILLGVEPTVDAAFLSAGGAGGVISILEREITTGQPLSCLVASAMGEACEDLGEDHPALTLIVQKILDPADPASFAHRFLRERPTDWAPLSVAMTEGETDAFTPPRSTEAMAAWAGIPIVEPVVQASDPLALLGPPTVPAPVSGNITLPSGDAVTAGLMQWPDVGHFAIYALEDAENRYRVFFETAITGTPTLPAGI